MICLPFLWFHCLWVHPQLPSPTRMEKEYTIFLLLIWPCCEPSLQNIYLLNQRAAIFLHYILTYRSCAGIRYLALLTHLLPVYQGQSKGAGHHPRFQGNIMDIHSNNEIGRHGFWSWFRDYVIYCIILIARVITSSRWTRNRYSPDPRPFCLQSDGPIKTSCDLL